MKIKAQLRFKSKLSMAGGRKSKFSNSNLANEINVF